MAVIRRASLHLSGILLNENCLIESNEIFDSTESKEILTLTIQTLS